MDGKNFCAKPQLGAAGGNNLCHRRGYGMITGDPGRGHIKRAKASNVRLNAGKSPGIEPLHLDAILLRAISSASIRCSSAALVATRSLPQASNARPCSLQKAFVAAAPSRQSWALRLPGV